MNNRVIFKLRKKGMALFLALSIVMQTAPMLAFAGQEDTTPAIQDSGYVEEDNHENTAKTDYNTANNREDAGTEEDAFNHDNTETPSQGEEDTDDADVSATPQFAARASAMPASEPIENKSEARVQLTIGDKTQTFALFSQAVQASNESDSEEEKVITILQDTEEALEEDATEAITVTKSVTLDLNGKTLTLANLYEPTMTVAQPLVVEEGTLSICDNTGDDGVLSFGNSGYGMRVADHDDAKLHIKNGTLTDFRNCCIVILGTSQDKVLIEGGTIRGAGQCINSAAGIEIRGGLIETTGNNYDSFAIFVTGYAAISNATVRSIHNYAIVTRYDGSSEDDEMLKLEHATIESEESSALRLETDQGTCNITGSTRITSDKSVAISIEKNSFNVDKRVFVKIDPDVVVDGGTQAISNQIRKGTKKRVGYAELFLNGGHYYFDAENYPAFENSKYINFCDAQGVNTDLVLSPTPEMMGAYAGSYSVVTKQSLEHQNEVGGTDGYQVFTDLNQTIDLVAEVYNTKNSNKTYSQEGWSAFTTAYENAVSALDNANANQQEIDLYTRQLTTSHLALEQELELEDISQLTDGVYGIQVNMYTFSFTNISMANSAVDSNAKLVIENGKPTLYVNFKPTLVMGMRGHMTDLRLHQGDTPAAAYANAFRNDDDMFDTARVSYTAWYTDDGEGGKVPAQQGDAGALPGTVAIKLPYFSNKGNDNRLYFRISVDVMTNIGVGDKDVVLYLKYSTLEAQEEFATLKLEDGPVYLIKGDAKHKDYIIQTNAKNLNEYTITWKSSNPEVATVDAQGKVSAVQAGTATITATATAGSDAQYSAIDGSKTILRSVPVTVRENGNAVACETTASDTKTSTKVTGDVLLSAENGVEVSSAKVCIPAVSDTAAEVTKAEVQMEAKSAEALVEAAKPVEIQTNIGTVTFSKEAIQSVGAANSDVTFVIEKTDIPESVSGVFQSAYRFELVKSQSGALVSFDQGTAKVELRGDDGSRFAYHVKDGKLVEKVRVFTYEDVMSFTTSHFSDWVLSTREYNVQAVEEDKNNTGNGNGGNGGNNTDSDFLLKTDGNYLVDVYLWNDAKDVASMGDVSLSNNRQALVTVENGKVTDVELATNPVQVGTYTSAITALTVTNPSKALTVLETASITTQPKGSTYDYIKRATFGLPDDAQPTSASEITYVPVTFVVPDTPMDAAVGETLPARIRFVWSTAQKTSKTSLVASVDTAKGTSKITGKDVEDIALADSVTGIRLETTTDYVSDKAKLAVATITSGTDFELAKTALADVAQSFALYAVRLTVDDKEIAPSGTVKVLFPSAGKALSIYRINSNGTKTKITGTVSGQYYVISTSALGLFAITEGELQPVQQEGLAFTDVANHWAKAHIALVVERGLFNGTSDTTFGPEASMTRGMFVTVLGRLAGVQAASGTQTKFADVASTAYYAPYVAWAYENGIVKGTSDTTYTPDQSITRQEMAVMLCNYSAYAKISLGTGSVKAFADAGDIADWAKDAVNTLASAGVINGVSETQFAPRKTATRAEVAALLAKFITAYKL